MMMHDPIRHCKLSCSVKHGVIRGRNSVCCAPFGAESLVGQVVAERTHSANNERGTYAVVKCGSMQLTSCSSHMDGSRCCVTGRKRRRCPGLYRRRFCAAGEAFRV